VCGVERKSIKFYEGEGGAQWSKRIYLKNGNLETPCYNGYLLSYQPWY